MAKDERIEHTYRVFALEKDGRKTTYVSEGPGSLEATNLPDMGEWDMRTLAREVFGSHEDYISKYVTRCHVYMPDEEGIHEEYFARYIAINFNPPGEAALYGRNIYRTRRLTKQEQEEFLVHLERESRESISKELEELPCPKKL